MIKHLKNNLKKNLLLYNFSLQNFFRHYDNSLKDKKVFFSKYYLTVYGKCDPNNFISFIKDQRYWAEKRLKLFRFLYTIRYAKALTIYLLFCLIIIIKLILLNTKTNDFEQIFLIFLVSYCAFIFPFSPTNNQITTQINYIDYLDELIQNEAKRINTLDKIVNNNNEALAVIKIHLTRNELAACIAMHINSKTIELVGVSRQQLCTIIEDNCCDSNGKEYNTLKTILADFINDNKNANTALESYLKKLNQNNT